jgi:hypothetical protein
VAKTGQQGRGQDHDLGPGHVDHPTLRSVSPTSKWNILAGQKVGLNTVLRRKTSLGTTLRCTADQEQQPSSGQVVQTPVGGLESDLEGVKRDLPAARPALLSLAGRGSRLMIAR